MSDLPDFGHFARRMDDFAKVLTFDAIRRFVAVAECGGFRQAARQLNIAQPSLSRSIQDLEHRIGDRVFERGRRGVVLTPAGAVLMRHAQILYADMRDAANAIASLRSSDTDEIIVGLNPSVASQLAPRALGAFADLLPAVRVYLVETRPEHLLVGVEKGQFELAISPTPFAPVSDAITVERIGAFPYVVIARAGHPLLDQPVVKVQHLSDYDWILPEPGTVTARRLERLIAAMPDKVSRCTYRTVSLTLSAQLALMSGHLFSAPLIAVRDLIASGRFGIVRVHDFKVSHEINVLQRKVSLPKASTRLLISKLREQADLLSAETAALLRELHQGAPAPPKRMARRRKSPA